MSATVSMQEYREAQAEPTLSLHAYLEEFEALLPQSVATRLLCTTQMRMKRLVDVSAATFILVMLSPLWFLIAALIKLTSQGPVFYKSKRIGQHQQPFYMYKFRTMGVDADRQREALREQHNQSSQLFKLENDPRITSVGVWLRRFSLDEFPQLLNVIKGEMSLVGPRPFAPDDSALFKGDAMLRFAVLPGMTGKWQVSGRSLLNFDDLCNLDIEYVQTWSPMKDIELLFKTIPAVLLNRGAY